MDSIDPTQKLGNIDRNPQTIEVVYAGGTISSMATTEGHREGGYAQDLVELLREHSPELDLAIELGDKQYAYTGLSENLTREDQERIAGSVAEGIEKDSNGVFVSHGTDSLEQTALLLHERFDENLKQSGKKVIITAANEDLEHPQTDAWDNLQFALESFWAEVPGGVYVAFHGKLIPADEVVKMPYGYNEHATFTSVHDPEYAPAQQQQRLADKEQIAALHEKMGSNPAIGETMLYDANVIRPDHQPLLNYLASHNVKAILLNLYHSGTANTVTPGQSVAELVGRLHKEKGIVFFGVTENGEPTDLHSYETSVELRRAGVVPLYTMSKAVAEAKLRLLADEDPDMMVVKMLKSRAGEIDETQIIDDDIVELIEFYSRAA